MTPRFRPALPADAALVHLLLTEMAAETGAAIKGTLETFAAAAFGPVPLIHALLAEAALPLGVITYFAEYSTWRGETGLFIQDIYLRPKARRQGLGRALIREALHIAPFSVDFITLMVADKNPRARAFYEILGFTLRDAAGPMILSGPALTRL